MLSASVLGHHRKDEIIAVSGELSNLRNARRINTTNVRGALILGGAHGSLAVARSLGRRGIPVWVVLHDHPIAKFSRYVSRSFTWPGPQDGAATELLLDFARFHHLEGWVLFAGGDAEVLFVAQNFAELSALFLISTPPWAISQVACDKHLTYRHAQFAGVGYPQSYRPRDRSEVANLACQFPVILKPATRGQINAFTMAKAWKANDRAELLSHYDAAVALVGHDSIVLQEFVPGSGKNQFSYAAIWSDGRPVASLIARRVRQYPIDFGFTSTFVETIENDKVEAAATRFLDALHYDGIVELEFKFDERDNSYKLLDFNARPWTWIALGAKAGVDFPYLLWQAVTGGHPQQSRASGSATWIHVSRDLVSAAQNILAGRISVSDFIASLRPPIVFAAFAWDDPFPGIIELPLTLARALARRAPKNAEIWRDGLPDTHRGRVLAWF
ncbi:MAG: hypothetical protein NVS2B5_04730 [Beijerinckiaceae bacterium]